MLTTLTAVILFFKGKKSSLTSHSLIGFMLALMFFVLLSTHFMGIDYFKVRDASYNVASVIYALTIVPFAIGLQIGIYHLGKTGK